MRRNTNRCRIDSAPAQSTDTVEEKTEKTSPPENQSLAESTIRVQCLQHHLQHIRRAFVRLFPSPECALWHPHPCGSIGHREPELLPLSLQPVSSRRPADSRTPLRPPDHDFLRTGLRQPSLRSHRTYGVISSSMSRTRSPGRGIVQCMESRIVYSCCPVSFTLRA